MRKRSHAQIKSSYVSSPALLCHQITGSHNNALVIVTPSSFSPSLPLPDSSLLSALSRSRDKNAPYRANEVFDQMLSAGIRADPMAWTILITLWSKSSLPNKEMKVQQIFKRYVILFFVFYLLCAAVYMRFKNMK